MAGPLIDLDSVRRVYGRGATDVVALDGVSLTIEAGEFVAVMGTSGSGKSTLMNILGCLDRPTDGRYRVRGVEVATLDADDLAALRRDTFGLVFQRYNLLLTATALENVEIPAIYAGTTVADNLFGDEAGAVGRFVLVGGAPFEVAGVLTARGATPWGNDQDDVVLLPITTGMMRLFGQSYLSGITVAVGDTKRIDATEAAGTHVTMPASFDNAAPADRRSTPGSVQEAGQGGTSSAIRR